MFTQYTNIMIRLLKYLFLLLLLIPLIYLLLALLLSFISVNNTSEKGNKAIYLKSNGIHLDIIIPSSCLSIVKTEHPFVAIGWGDKKFYLETPKAKDLTFTTAFKALFLQSESLLHLTNYDVVKKDWVKICVTKAQLSIISSKVEDQFDIHDLKPIKGYGLQDFFYKSNGSYSCLNTCNTWVNSLLKKAEVKACLWTPFSFRLIDIHRLSGFS
jgi:uncharacterized protein (TIGR02117 family)